MSEITAPISAEPVTAQEVTESVTNETELTESTETDTSASQDSNKEESFSDWLARQKGSTKTEPETVEKRQDLETAPTEKPVDFKEAPEYKELSEKSSRLEAEVAQKAQEFEGLQGQVKDLLQALRTPGRVGEVFDKLSVPREALEQYYYEKYVKPETMTVEEKLAAYQQRDEQARVQEQERQQAEQAKQQEAEQVARVKANQEHWTKTINEALSGAGIPTNDWTLSRMAAYIKQSYDRGVPVEASAVVGQVRADLVQLQQITLKDLPVEKLVETLGEEQLARIRSHEVNKLRQGNKFEAGKKAGTPVKREEKERKVYKSAYDVLNDL